MENICKDLQDEYESLDAVVSGLSESEWDTVTPFDDWTIRDEISHIAYFDEAAKLSTVSTEAFNEHMQKMLEGIKDYDDMHKKINAVGGSLSASELLSWWRSERQQLIENYRKFDPKDRLPWYGPTMSARSSATARVMETWAHGQDIFDALKMTRPKTNRLKHVAHIGVTTFGWAYINRKLSVPENMVRVELTSPTGDIWSWNQEAENELITGDAEDFCLVVTQRRHLSDTKLVVKGEIASDWMKICQAFAGPPEDGPAPGERVV